MSENYDHAAMARDFKARGALRQKQFDDALNSICHKSTKSDEEVAALRARLHKLQTDVKPMEPIGPALERENTSGEARRK